MAFGDKVQGDSGYNSVAGLNASIPITATPGNMLVLNLAGRGGIETITAIANGWDQKAHFWNNSNFGGGIFTKIADGVDDVDIDWTNDATSAWIWEEYEGPFDSAIAFGGDATQVANSSATSVGGTTVSPNAAPGIAVSLWSCVERLMWANDNTDVSNNISVDDGFSKDEIYAWQNTRPCVGLATKTTADLSAVLPEWFTNQGGGPCYAGTVVGVSPVAPSGSWDLTDVNAAQDAQGLDGLPNTASTVTATAGGGTAIAAAPQNVASQNCVARYFLKRLTGVGEVALTLDGGATWSAVPELPGDTFLECLIEATTATPQIGMRIAESGDAVVVGNAELHMGINGASVQHSQFIYTESDPVTVYSEAGEVQTGVWSPAPTWVCE